MRNEYRSLANTPVNTVVAVILIGLGLVWVLRPSIYIDLGLLTGPGFITALGMLLFVMALNVDPPAGELLAIVGTVVAMVGMILAYQDVTHQWAAWIYAWALVLPTSIGLGQVSLRFDHRAQPVGHHRQATRPDRASPVSGGRDLL